MLEANEYTRIMQKFYEKSLILESPNDFHPVFHFYFVDALAHIDFTLGIQAYNYMSPRNVMNMEYMRWRMDEGKVGDRVHFPDFINWLKEVHPDKFEELPMLWTGIYDRDDPAQYRSFRIVLDPDSKKPIPPEYLSMFVEEFFNREFLKQLYKTSKLARLFDEFVKGKEV